MCVKHGQSKKDKYKPNSSITAEKTLETWWMHSDMWLFLCLWLWHVLLQGQGVSDCMACKLNTGEC